MAAPVMTDVSLPVLLRPGALICLNSDWCLVLRRLRRSRTSAWREARSAPSHRARRAAAMAVANQTAVKLVLASFLAGIAVGWVSRRWAKRQAEKWLEYLRR